MNKNRSHNLCTHTNELESVVRSTRSAFLFVAVFSLFINLLMLTAPVYMLQVYNRVLTSGSHETLLFLTIMAGVAVFVMCVLDTLRTSVTVRIGCWLNERLSPVFMAAGVRAQLKGDPNGIQSFHDINQIQGFVANQGLVAFFDAPWVPIFIVVVWILHPWLGAIALVSAILLLILSILNDQATRKQTSIASQKQIDANRIADTTIRNADVVRAMGFLPALISRWQNTNSVSVEAVRSAGEAGGIVMALTKFVRFFVQIAILGMGAWLVLKNELTPGGMIAASIMLGRALAPVEMAIGAWKNFVASRIAYQRLRSQLETHPPEPERIWLPEPQGRLDVENMSYIVPGTSHLLLSQIAFSLPPGEVAAVVGPSGVGKSTLCRVLTGLAAPSTGSVRLDGADIRNWNPDQLGQYVGYLPQVVELFDGTVRENIARMRKADDGDVVDAAIAANAHDVIQQLPEGYDTRLGLNGVQLSGGQRQRVGLARAMFGNPKIVILDEPNANLDQAGEAALGQAIENMKARGCAVIIVGHRPSTLAHADSLLVIQSSSSSIFGARDDVLRIFSGDQEPEATDEPLPADAASGTAHQEIDEPGAHPAIAAAPPQHNRGEPATALNGAAR